MLWGIIRIDNSLLNNIEYSVVLLCMFYATNVFLIDLLKCKQNCSIMLYIIERIEL